MKRLMKVLTTVMFLASICTSLSAFASSKDKAYMPVLKKIYVQPDQLFFDHSGMYVGRNSEWVRTNAIYSDADGLYIVDEQGQWICLQCRRWTSSNLWTCDHCGAQR